MNSLRRANRNLRTVKDDSFEEDEGAIHVEPVFQSPPATTDTGGDVTAVSGAGELNQRPTLLSDPQQPESGVPELSAEEACGVGTEPVHRASRKVRIDRRQHPDTRDDLEPHDPASQALSQAPGSPEEKTERPADGSQPPEAKQSRTAVADVKERKEKLPDASRTDAEVSLPQIDLSDPSIEVKLPAPRNSAKHYFDQLKINFLARYAATVKSVLFLGISRGNGASTAAFSFAKSLAQDADLRVLFINADLRDPSLAFKVRHPASNSRSVALWDPHGPMHVQQDNLHMVPGGRGYVDPAVLFQSKRFDDFIGQVSKRYHYVVIDGPPLDEAPESVALITKVDGVILVLDAQLTRRKIALYAKRRIDDVGGHLLGVVLNRRIFYVPSWLYTRL